MKKLKNGQIQNATHHRCSQTQCAFYLRGGCKACEDCNAEPYELQNDCARCYACEHIPDALRWGDQNLTALNDAKIKMKQEQLIEIGGIK